MALRTLIVIGTAAVGTQAVMPDSDQIVVADRSRFHSLFEGLKRDVPGVRVAKRLGLAALTLGEYVYDAIAPRVWSAVEGYFVTSPANRVPVESWVEMQDLTKVEKKEVRRLIYKLFVIEEADNEEDEEERKVGDSKLFENADNLNNSWELIADASTSDDSQGEGRAVAHSEQADQDAEDLSFLQFFSPEVAENYHTLSIITREQEVLSELFLQREEAEELGNETEVNRLQALIHSQIEKINSLISESGIPNLSPVVIDEAEIDALYQQYAQQYSDSNELEAQVDQAVDLSQEAVDEAEDLSYLSPEDAKKYRALSLIAKGRLDLAELFHLLGEAQELENEAEVIRIQALIDAQAQKVNLLIAESGIPNLSPTIIDEAEIDAIYEQYAQQLAQESLIL